MWVEAFGLGTDYIRKNRGIWSHHDSLEYCGGISMDEDPCNNAVPSLKQLSGQKKPRKLTPLQMQHVHHLFKVYAIGIGLACCAFLAELARPILHRHNICNININANYMVNL
jgi:hypothetical protein